MLLDLAQKRKQQIHDATNKVTTALYPHLLDACLVEVELL